MGKIVAIILYMMFQLDACVTGRPMIPAGCQRKTISQVDAPGGSARAYVYEDVCTDGGFTTVVTNNVVITPLPQDEAQSKNVLTVDYGGDLETIPRIAWQDDHRLTVTI